MFYNGKLGDYNVFFFQNWEKNSQVTKGVELGVNRMFAEVEGTAASEMELKEKVAGRERPLASSRPPRGRRLTTNIENITEK